MANYPKNDPRVFETRKHLKQLSKRFERPIEVNDYLDYRNKHAPHLPNVDTLLSMFGTWDALLRECNIDPERGSEDLSRIPDPVLIKALQSAAADLKITQLSSHAYDRWRTEFIASGKVWDKKYPDPPSSSVIRKWL